tara:strand:- start:182 stop:358 length:177 start_codon:yes stop_codon:yes gene_type:complete
MKNLNEFEEINETNQSFTSEEKKKLIYILKMKLKDYEENGRFFAEEIKIVKNILNKIS